MSVRSGQVITAVFTTRSVAGVGTPADALPDGALYVNGVRDAAAVAVALTAGNVYTATTTLPALVIGDGVDIVITATVLGVTDTDRVWCDGHDLAIDAAGLVGVSSATPIPVTLVASALDAIIIATGLTERFKLPSGAPVTQLNLRQALAVLIAVAAGDRHGVDTRDITARLPGETTAVTAVRVSRTEIQTTATVPE